MRCCKDIFFSQTIPNIFESIIFNKTITCNDKDPQWSNGEIRYLIYKYHIRMMNDDEPGVQQ